MSERRVFRTVVESAGSSSATGLVVPFDPKEVWGAVRVPVVVRIGSYAYRSTIAKMGGRHLIPLAREHREAAGVAAGDEVEVTLTRDTRERTVDVPADLAASLDDAALRDAFDALAFTHRKEHVRAIEDAKKPETRARRIGKVIEAIRGG